MPHGLQIVCTRQLDRVVATMMDRKSRILSFFNTESTLLNSRTKYINCTLCQNVFSLREFNSHVKREHSCIYKRKQCNYCFNFRYKTPNTGKQHKIECLSGKILPDKDGYGKRETDLLNNIKEKNKIIHTQYVKIKELEIIIEQLSENK